jgi:hypothetical protein
MPDCLLKISGRSALSTSSEINPENCKHTTRMNINQTTSRVIASLAGLLLSGAVAHAQLELTGTTWGVFSSPVGGVNTIANGNPISTFTTGTVMGTASAANPHTSIKFSGDAGASQFDLIGDGDQDNFGKITITNGSDLIGTDATSVSMDLFADFSNIGLTDFDLTTLTFNLISTPDGSTPGGVPDTYVVTATPFNSFTFDNVMVSFSLLNVGDPDSFFNLSGRSIKEKKFGSENVILGVTETVLNAVPEPSTYALWACVLLGGAVLLRRRSSANRSLA